MIELFLGAYLFACVLAAIGHVFLWVVSIGSDNKRK